MNWNPTTLTKTTNYRFIIETFIDIGARYAPLKRRFIRRNQVSFMNKELGKTIYDRSMLRNTFFQISKHRHTIEEHWQRCFNISFLKIPFICLNVYFYVLMIHKWYKLRARFTFWINVKQFELWKYIKNNRGSDFLDSVFFFFFNFIYLPVYEIDL